MIGGPKGAKNNRQMEPVSGGGRISQEDRMMGGGRPKKGRWGHMGVGERVKGKRVICSNTKATIVGN